MRFLGNEHFPFPGYRKHSTVEQFVMQCAQSKRKTVWFCCS